jgi:tetraacyldisaccharide 4'-kinase
MKLLLIPFSYLFRIIVFIRNMLYDHRFLKAEDLRPAVISIGNIAAGGTGKTPFVELLADYLLDKGKFIVIILKGYKREQDDMKVVELGFKNEDHELNAENFGDEAFVLLENLSKNKNGKGLLIVGDDKTKTAKFADAKFKPQIIIIEDGYQHRKLARDLDIVIINPHHDKYLIPAGNLREPMKNINRSDLVVVNNKFDKFAIAENTRSKPKVTCNYEFEGFFNIKNEMIFPEKIAQEISDAVVFCAVGEPESFKKLIADLNIKINDFIKFPDHHYFSISDMEKIVNSFNKSGAKYLITTQKDFVRIKNSELVLKASGENAYKNLLFNYPLYYAKIKMQINQNAEQLYKELDELLN